MAVVNVGQSEAKVECLFTEFLQLRWGETTFFCLHPGAGSSFSMPAPFLDACVQAQLLYCLLVFSTLPLLELPLASQPSHACRCAVVNLFLAFPASRSPRTMQTAFYALPSREDTRFSCHNAGGGALDTLLGDEDQEDNYMVTAGGANEGGGEEGGKKGAAGGKKGGAKAAAGSKGGKGGKGAGAARGLKKTVGGGVKKAKAGAGGKGKGKGAKPKAGGGAKAAKAKPKAKAGGVKKAAGKGK